MHIVQSRRLPSRTSSSHPNRLAAPPRKGALVCICLFPPSTHNGTQPVVLLACHPWSSKRQGRRVLRYGGAWYGGSRVLNSHGFFTLQNERQQRDVVLEVERTLFSPKANYLNEKWWLVRHPRLRGSRGGYCYYGGMHGRRVPGR